MKIPLLGINYKTYSETLGNKALKLSQIAKRIAEEKKVTVVVGPQTTDLRLITTKLPQSEHFKIYSQHLDHNGQGAFTGSVTAEAVKFAGALGTFLNHAEKKLKLDNIQTSIKNAKAIGLELIVFADSIEEAKKIASLNPKPQAIALEPPELIGSGISVSTAKPEIVENSVMEIKKISKDIHVFVGAGISSAYDIKRSLELGATGALFSSGYVKSKDPEKLLSEMAEECLKFENTKSVL